MREKEARNLSGKPDGERAASCGGKSRRAQIKKHLIPNRKEKVFSECYLQYYSIQEGVLKPQQYRYNRYLR